MSPKFPQSSSLIVSNITFTSSFLWGAKIIFGYYGPLRGHVWGPWPVFLTIARFWPKQCSYQVREESVKKCGFYCVNGHPGLRATWQEIAGDRIKDHQNIFPDLKLDCAKYQVCTTYIGGGGGGVGIFREQKQNSMAVAEMGWKHSHPSIRVT